MRAERSAVEPDLACSGALSLITSGFVWHCPFVDTVRFSCLLGCCWQTGTVMTCPAQCHWRAQCQIITCLVLWNGSPPLEWKGFCIVKAKYQYVTYLYCLAVRSRWHHDTHLPHFLMWKVCSFPGCVAGALALSGWWGSLFFLPDGSSPCGHLGTGPCGNKIPLPVMKSVTGFNCDLMV